MDELPAVEMLAPLVPPPPPPTSEDFDPGELPLAAADFSADILGLPPPVELPPECSGCFGDTDEPCLGL